MLVPATKHSILRRWLARRGFALRGETLCQAAGRWYAVMNAQYTGDAREPDGAVLPDRSDTGAARLRGLLRCAEREAEKYRLGLPDGAERDAVGELIAEMDTLAAR